MVLLSSCPDQDLTSICFKGSHTCVYMHVGTVASTLFERLGQRGAPIAQGLLARLGDLIAGAADTAEAAANPTLQTLMSDEGEGDESDAAAGKAEAAMGAAIRFLGPEAVLAVLPLNLMEVRCRHGFGRHACHESVQLCL